MTKPFSNRVVVITGAGHGIGRVTALGFAANGAQVVAADVDADAAGRTSALISGHGGQAHVRQAPAWRALARREAGQSLLRAR